MKTLALLTFLLAVPVARADSPRICRGLDIKTATTRIGDSAIVEGRQPLQFAEETCGGGLNSVGEKIPEWTCFKQKWGIVDDEARTHVLYTYYVSRDGSWFLTGASMCPVAGEDDCEHMDLTDCEQ